MSLSQSNVATEPSERSSTGGKPSVEAVERPDTFDEDLRRGRRGRERIPEALPSDGPRDGAVPMEDDVPG